MSNLMKIAIPLINNKITLDDLKQDTGFVNAYFQDINKPYLNNHVFLLYDCNAKGTCVLDYRKKLENLPEFYNKRIEYIQNKPYLIYCFVANEAINQLRDGNIILNQTDKLRVLQFWQFTDIWIDGNIIRGTMYTNPDTDSVPEVDCRESIEIDGNKKGGELVISTSPYIFLCSHYNNSSDSFKIQNQNHR